MMNVHLEKKDNIKITKLCLLSLSVLLVVTVFLKFSDLSFQMVDVLSASFKFVFQLCNLLTGFLFCRLQFLLCPLLQLPNCTDNTLISTLKKRRQRCSCALIECVILHSVSCLYAPKVSCLEVVNSCCIMAVGSWKILMLYNKNKFRLKHQNLILILAS